MFRVNFNVLIQMLISDKSLLTPLRLSWLTVVVSQTKSLYCTFFKYRKEKLSELSYTGQVAYLERYLNDRWDFYNRTIVVENVAPLSRLYIAAALEAEPIYVGANSEAHFYLGAIEEYVRTYDVIIHIPATTLVEYMINGTTMSLEATLKKYLQAGKRYYIDII